MISSIEFILTDQILEIIEQEGDRRRDRWEPSLVRLIEKVRNFSAYAI